MIAAAKNAYRQGLLDGYWGNPPEYRFLDVPRSTLELERWHAGHSDGEAVRRLDEDSGTTHGITAIRRLALRPRDQERWDAPKPDYDPRVDYPERYTDGSV